MPNMFIKICAAAAVVAAMGAAPASAASMQYGAELQNVAQFSFGISSGDNDRGRFERRGNYGYYNGHRGYRERRSGYRFFNGFYFPQSAFSFNFSVGGNRGGLSSRHVAWCEDHYRSYRASDNTFQPYNGPRQECVSPYRR